MAEELQHLLQRIRTEAVEASQSEAEEILSRARHQAATVVSEAEAKAQALLREAETESQVYTERSSRALEQAGRDLLISAGLGIQKLVEQVVGDAVADAFSDTFLQEQIGKIISAWLENKGAGLEIRVSPADEEAMRAFIQLKFQRALSAGLVVRADSAIGKGFRVSYDGTHAFHDFTAPAIADALAGRVRPRLAEIIHRVARETTESPT